MAHLPARGGTGFAGHAAIVVFKQFSQVFHTLGDQHSSTLAGPMFLTAPSSHVPGGESNDMSADGAGVTRITEKPGAGSSKAA